MERPARAVARPARRQVPISIVPRPREDVGSARLDPPAIVVEVAGGVEGAARADNPGDDLLPDLNVITD